MTNPHLWARHNRLIDPPLVTPEKSCLAPPPWLQKPNSATSVHTVSSGRALQAEARDEWNEAWKALGKQMGKNKKSFKKNVIAANQKCQLPTCKLTWLPGLHTCSGCNNIIHKHCACLAPWWDLTDLGCLYCSAECHTADTDRRTELLVPFCASIVTDHYNLEEVIYHTTDNQMWLQEAEDWKKLNPWGHTTDFTDDTWHAFCDWGQSRIIHQSRPIHGLGELLATATTKNWKNQRPKTQHPQGGNEHHLEGGTNTKKKSPHTETTNDIAQAAHNDISNKPAPPTD